MALAVPWALVFVARSPAERYSGYGLAGLAVAACLYIVFNERALGDQYGSLCGPLQTAIAVVLIAAVLEMGRRFIGWPLPLVAVIALLFYGLFGQYVPGELGHEGLPVGSFLGTLTIAEGGLWGPLTAVSVNIVAVFVIFGAVLRVRPETYGVFSTSWKDVPARKGAEGDAGASSRGFDAAGAAFQLVENTPYVSGRTLSGRIKKLHRYSFRFPCREACVFGGLSA